MTPLWLCLHFAQLPVEVFANSHPLQLPLATSNYQNGRPCILCCDTQATQSGIAPGMPCNAALALLPNLDIRARSIAAEHQRMKRISIWAYQFSSKVHLQQNTLSMEIAASQALFGGIKPLLKEIISSAHMLANKFTAACAPTPAAAALLANNGIAHFVTQASKLDQALAGINLSSTPLAAKTISALRQTGINSIGTLKDLPRGEVARRFGQQCLDYLDTLTGRRIEPLQFTSPPEYFAAELTLPLEASNTEHLLFAAKRLLNELGGFLNMKDQATQSYTLHLQHHYHQDSLIKVQLMQPARLSAYLLQFLSYKMQTFVLPENVHSLKLTCRHFTEYQRSSLDLFEVARPQDEWHTLIEKIRARIGPRAIRFIHSCPDHRPEKAWQYGQLEKKTEIQTSNPRPLWIFPQPRPLTSIEQLKFISGPERIESGWWDDQDVRRDYYVVRGTKGAKLWIFRKRQPPGDWFVHGVFS